ncbi:MAG: hypothetical protein ACK5LT_11800 [Lachnospirales bacterium]
MPFLILMFNVTFKLSTYSSGLLFCIIMLLLIPVSMFGGKLANQYNKKTIILITRFAYAIALIIYMFADIALLK